MRTKGKTTIVKEKRQTNIVGHTEPAHTTVKIARPVIVKKGILNQQRFPINKVDPPDSASPLTNEMLG